MAKLHEAYARYNRLTNLMDFASKKLCSNVFIKENFPSNGQLLYNRLKECLCQENFNSKDLISLFPSSGKTDVLEWDLNLFMKVIEELFGQTYCELLRDLRQRRKCLHDKGNKELSSDEYDTFYRGAKEILGIHGFAFNMLSECGWEDTFLIRKEYMNNVIFTTQGSVNILFLQYNAPGNVTLFC